MNEKSLKPGQLAPWIQGIIETMVGALMLKESTIPHRNRLAVLLLDSAFETTCRIFLKYKVKIKLKEAHKHREDLITTVRSNLKEVDAAVWDTLDFYYQDIRCDLYHESASKTITDESYGDYRETVEFTIDKMLDVRVEQLVRAYTLSLANKTTDVLATTIQLPQLHNVEEDLDKILIAIATLNPKGFDEVNGFFKKAGDSLRLDKNLFTNVLARNSGTKKYFYFNKDLKVWQLSSLGEYRLKQIGNGE